MQGRRPGRWAWLLVGLWLASLAAGAQVESELEVSARGRELARRLQGMEVETRWLPGFERIDWETGLGNGQLARKRKTWCSAFVAAACQGLGVYILRPPEHALNYLSNAQQEWLLGPGAEAGWVRVPGSTALDRAREAQRQANQGWLVVASWRSPEARRAGHIALVLPGSRTVEELQRDGPWIINVGSRNSSCTTLRKAFSNHPGAFGRGEILFFAHALP